MEVKRMEIDYAFEPQLTAAEFIDVLKRSTLAERRPIDQIDTMAGMLSAAQVICTARSAGKLVGVSRAISDFAFCTYLADLAVDAEFQKQGIGRKLIHLTHEAAGEHTMLVLLAAPQAADYYPHIGMTKHDSCWIIHRK
jgi:GNAT superfamily N-acetyltransferase